MVIGIQKPLSVGGINPNIYVATPSTGSCNHVQSDTFERSGLDRYTTETAIIGMIKQNPKILTILKQMNAPLNLNMKELKDLMKHHAADTKKIALGITENLPFALKNRVNINAVEEAAYLHDLGKVLIPPEVLNKPGKLNEKEISIMHRHSELSYELLKTTDLNKKTLDIIRNHHQNAQKTGYPWVNKDFNADLNLQIVSMADKFSALTEKRTYKESLSDKQALTIIYRDVQEGKLHPLVFKALADYTKSNTKLTIA